MGATGLPGALRARWLCAWLLGVGLLAFAPRVHVHADFPVELRGQRVVAVRVAGDASRVVGPEIAGFAVGERLERSLVRRAIDDLISSGRWASVQVEAEPTTTGVVLVFHLEPRLTVRRIEVRGQRAFEPRFVLDALGLAAGSEVRADALRGLETDVRRAYAERGYYATGVFAHFRDMDDPADKVLLVEVEEGAPTRIEALRCSDPQLRDTADLFEAMGIARGGVLDRRALSAAIEQGERFLRSKFYLEARIRSPIVTMHGDQASVTFPLHLGPRYTLQVRGSEPLSATEVAAQVFLTDTPLTAEALAAIPERIKDIYAKHGFLHAKAAVRRALRSARQAELIARVQPGPQVRVVYTHFPGAHFFPRTYLQDQLFSFLDESVPSGLLRTVDSEVSAATTHGEPLVYQRVVPRPPEQDAQHTYYKPAYDRAVKLISELYQSEGFLAVQVSEPKLRDLDKTHVTVDIDVDEGPRTLLHSVVLRGNELFSTQELLIHSGLLRGAAFSFSALEAARSRLSEFYQERGHMFARIEPSVRYSSDRTRAEVSLQIVEGYPVHIGEIVVQGAERTNVQFIRSVLSLHPGDLFRPSAARQSEHALSNLGVIAGVTVQLEDPELPARVKRVIVSVSERANQFLDFSAGLSTGQGARAGFDYGYRNLFGYAVGMTLRVQFAYQLLFVRPELQERFDRLLFADRLERNIALGFVVPRTPGLGATRANLDFVHLRDNERDFGLDKNGVTLALTETPWSRVTLLEAADFENNNIDIFESQSLGQLISNTTDPRLRRLLRVPDGNTTLIALRLSVSYDQRDSAFVPTRGFFLSASSELASTLRLAPTRFFSRFLKFQITGSGYVPLGRSVVFAGQLRVGRIVHLQHGSQTYPNRAFFLGGVETLRGYYQDELIPQDIADVALDPSKSPEERSATIKSAVRNGDAFVLLRAELRFPLYGQLGGGLFADFGNLWNEADKMNPFDLRPTAGAGLRLNTPVGPIAVDYGFVLLRRRQLGEPTGTLHFSIGLF